MNTTLTKIVDIFIIELKKLYFNKQKRATVISKYSEHLAKGTFPTELNFHIPSFQLPATVDSAKITIFRSDEELLIRQFKITVLTRRRDVLIENFGELQGKSDNFFEQDNLTSILAKILPAEQIEGLLGHFEEIVKETKLQFALFASDFEKRKNLKNTASNAESMQVQEPANDMLKILEKLEQLQL